MAKRGYKVCWWFKSTGPKHCRTLSATQHRNSIEAAETVLMQNSRAVVRVVNPRGGGGGTVYRLQHGQVVKAGPKSP
jgi:hypothetical protein